MSAITSPTRQNWPAAAIFDLDGTLVDSAPDIASAANQALATQDITINARQARQFLGHGARTFMARLMQHQQRACSAHEIDRLTTQFSAAYQRQPCVHSTCFPGATQALAQLQQRQIKTAVCTNKPRAIATQVLDKLELSPWLDVVVGAGQYALKPDPAPLQACMQQLAVTADATVYIGDMAVDRQAGHAAGARVILVEFGYAETAVHTLGADATLHAWPALSCAIAQVRTGNHGDQKLS